MKSLFSYDKGTKKAEGANYQEDIDAGIEAMKLFLSPLRKYNKMRKKNKKSQYKPRMVFLIGNHEQRIARHVNANPELENKLGYHDFKLEEMGWEVYPFLQPVIIDDIAYCHYFTSGVMGRPVSSAKLMLAKKYMSCIMGHVQDRDIAYARKADGTNIIGLFSGIYYQHDEDYLTPQTNGSWSGIWLLNEVANGGCDELPVSINYLREKHGDRKESHLLR